MKKTILLLVMFLSVYSFASNNRVITDELIKRTEKWYQEHPGMHPHWLTPEDIKNFDKLGKDFVATDPPQGPVRQTAEFERMQSVLISYPDGVGFGIPVELIYSMSQVTDIVTLYESSSSLQTIIQTFISAGIDTSKCDFLMTSVDSYWTRDFGPWYVVDGDNEVGVCDFIYNRPVRPNDDAVPSAFAPYMDEPYYGMSVVHTGGNYMTDGMGISASTTIVYEESNSTLGISSAEVDQRMNDYLGIHTYHVVDDPNNTYIDHIDCWGKFLDIDKILIRSVPVTHAQYDEIEATAAYFASQNSSYGVPYQVYRVYTPNDEPYTNSLILNDHVFVPVTGGSNDAAALAVYESAMPGYTITGVINNTSTPWESTDALHCRTRGVVDKEMLHIYHVAKVFDQSAGKNIEISAKVVSYGGHAVTDVRLYYSVDGGQWQNSVMTPDGGYYKGYVPPQTQGSLVKYYIRSEDSSGRIETHPFIGSADPHEFRVEYIPEISVSETDTVRVTIPSNSTAERNFTISNEGGLDLNYEVSYSYDGYAGVSVQTGNLHENDFSVFPGTGYTNTNWTSYSGGAQVTGNGITGILTSPQFQTDGFETVYLDFDQNFSFQAGSFSKVEYDNGSGWVEVYYQDSQSTSAHQTISLPTGPTGMIRFTGYTRRVSGFTASWFIDNIQIVGTNVDYTPYTWLSLLPPVSGTLTPSSNSQLDLTCDSSGLAEGSYFADIIIASNDLNNPEVKVTVQLNVSQSLSAPSNLTVINVTSSQTVLDWDPVSGALIYHIYRSDDPYSGFTEIGTSLTDSYTDNDILTGNKYFYYITAGDAK